MLKNLFKSSHSRSALEIPDFYNPKLHYNCLIEAAPSQVRSAMYLKLRIAHKIHASHYLPDGRLQLIVTDAGAGLDALNAVSQEKHAAFSLTKKDMILLMMREPDREGIFLLQTGVNSHHAERHRFSEIRLDSEQAFRKGVSLHMEQRYLEAVACYDEAIQKEPLDFRAWINKITALAQAGRKQAALETADEILKQHPDVGLLWEAKGRVLVDLGRGVEAGECLARAFDLDKKIAQDYKIDQQVDEWFQKIMDEARKEGRDPDKEAGFWFGKFAECIKSGTSNDMAGKENQARQDVSRAWICLQMAVKIGPECLVVSDPSGAYFAAPGSIVLEMSKHVKDAKVETLRDFALRMESHRHKTGQNTGEQITSKSEETGGHFQPAGEEPDDWLQKIAQQARLAGKDPDQDVYLWFNQYNEYMLAARDNLKANEKAGLGENFNKALKCLERAARIKPDYCVLSDSSGMMLLPPDHFYLSPEHLEKSAKVLSLQEYHRGLVQRSSRTD